MLISEVEELADRAEDLANLGIAELHVDEVAVEGLPSRWLATIVSDVMTVDRRSVVFDPWALALRPSREEARGAAVSLLRGIAKARRRAIREFPWMDDGREAYEAERRRVVEGDVLPRWQERWRKQFDVEEEEQRRSQEPKRPGRVPEAVEAWAAAIRAARLEQGWIQTHVAKNTGLTQSRLSQLERAQSAPKQDEAGRLATFLGVAPPVPEAGQ